MKPYYTLILFFASLVGAFAQPALIPSSPGEQAQVFEELAAKTGYAAHETDAEGNIIFICLNQMGPEKPFHQGRPGLGDDDLARLLHFPKLQAITLVAQPATDAGYAVLKSFPDLRSVRLGNLCTPKPEPAEAGAPTSATIAHLDGARKLQILDLTHTFRMDDADEVLASMQGFPELEVLIVDVGISNRPEALLDFIAKCPKIKRLKLHRTTLSEADFARLLSALPDLEYLEIKPSGNKPGERWSHQSLALLRDHRSVKVLRLIQGDALPLPWKNGLEHVVEARGLEVLRFPNRGYEIRGREQDVVPEADLERLRQARPELIINPPKAILEERMPNPSPFHWDAGPN